MRQTRPAAVKDVQLHDGFWKKRADVNREKTIPHEHTLCSDTGRIDVFRAVWDSSVEVDSHKFWDSDLAKWIEAASYSLATQPDAELDARLDEVIEWIEKAQQPDGYLNTYFTLREPENRWSNLRDHHELYCAGHLMEAAVAHYDATGKRTLLDVMCRYADYIDTVFGTADGKTRGYPGHEEIELALVKLYRATKERKYLDLAKYFVDQRGAQPHYWAEEGARRGEDAKNAGDDPAARHAYNQAHLPVREQTTAEGHSVRALYLFAGMADVAAETDDTSLLEACKTLWNNIVTKRMYVHGGVGSDRHGERFSYDYDLPNGTAYAETCANIALAFFAHRLLQVEPRAAYADVMELALYNSVVSGVSLDGTKFFYDNVLTVQPQKNRFARQKPPFRQEWFGCACCPPNIARLLASIGQYIYSSNDNAAYVHLYAAGTASLSLGDVPVTLATTTDYPWDERVKLVVGVSAPAAFTIALRVPGWCDGATLVVNGDPVDIAASTTDGYALVKRTWADGDTLELVLPMPVVRIEANPRVAADCGCVALKRGPVVYCLEEVDNGPGLAEISLPRDATLSLTPGEGPLAGVPLVTAEGRRRASAGWEGVLYRPACSQSEPARLTAVPYCLWDNRTEGEMLVWIRET